MLYKIKNFVVKNKKTTINPTLINLRFFLKFYKKSFLFKIASPNLAGG